MWLYALLFVCTLAQGCALTACALRLGRSLQILDFPDNHRKLHARATPRTGGVAICAALILGVIEAGCLPATGLVADLQAARFTLFLLLSALLLCGLGLWDDKYGMRARSKFLWQIVAVVPFVCWGRSTTTADLFGWHLDLAWLAVPVILFWLVACTNFVNLIDGLDGLASTVGLTVSLAVAVLAWWNQVPEACLLATILSGALVGFLLFNWPPARIFLGDSGSLPLGFLVGALALEAAAKKAAGLTLAVPLVLLSIPMFDTSMAILRRQLNGRKIGQGDRAHIHHCLRDRGWSPTQTLLAIGAMCMATAAAAVLATVFSNDLIAIGICFGVLAILIAGRLFGFNEAVLLGRHFQAVGKFLKSVPRALRVKFVVVRLQGTVAAGQLDLWHKIMKRAKRLGGLEIEFACEQVPSGKIVTALTWSAPAKPDMESPVWELHYSVPRGNGMQTRIDATGVAKRATGLAWLNELSEMLVSLCDNWPVEETTTIALEEAPLAGAQLEAAPTVEMSHGTAVTEEPRILTAHWGAPRSDRTQQESSRHIRGSDAA